MITYCNFSSSSLLIRGLESEFQKELAKWETSNLESSESAVSSEVWRWVGSELKWHRGKAFGNGEIQGLWVENRIEQRRSDNLVLRSLQEFQYSQSGNEKS